MEAGMMYLFIFAGFFLFQSQSKKWKAASYRLREEMVETCGGR